MDLVFNSKDGSQWRIILFQFFTVLTYSNSAINPLLYAFTNENFKKAFVGAFSCANVEFQDKHQTIEMQSKRQHRTQQEASGSKAYGREDCAKSRRRATAGFVFGRPAACIVRHGQGRSKSLVEYQFAVFKNNSNTALVNCCTTSPSQHLSSTRNVDRVVEITACSKLKEESSCSDQSVPL